MVRRFLIKVLVSAVALWAADALLSGFYVAGGLESYLIAGAVLALLNSFVRPLLKLFALPLIMITFGAFTLFINAAILWLVSDLVGTVSIIGLWTLLWATIIVSFVHMTLEPSAHE